ncbi:MAG: hypothetical protein FJ403_15010 [Verrucomicrobia bacterium]|nr:hypothetical protein [Verrucomicrobiota bacterium]
MNKLLSILFRLPGLVIAGLIFTINILGAEDAETQLRQLREQNQRLQEQMRQQQEMIDHLNTKLSEVLEANERRESEIRSLRDELKSELAAPEKRSLGLGKGK